MNLLPDNASSVAPYAIAFFIFGIFAFIVWISYIIRLWLVQTATFQIQEDLADIKDHILGNNVENTQPDLQLTVENATSVVEIPKKKIELKPRKPFLWIALGIPVLLVVLVVVLNIS